MTARHIKQVASDPQAAQINLMRNQHTDLPASKHKERKSFKSLDHPVKRMIQVTCNIVRRRDLMPRMYT